MAYTKIEQADLVGKGVVGLADTPGLETGAMQAKLDEIALDVIVPKFNNLCDELDENVGDAVQSPTITNIKLSADNTVQVSTDGGETYFETASSGHKIVNGAGVAFTQRSRLQFSSNCVVTDLPDDSATFVSVPSGQKGDKGDAATIQVGVVTSGDEASVINRGSTSDAIFDMVLPKGDQGDAATIQVGTVQSGDVASVSNRGTSGAAIFDFTLPKGEKGDPGTGLSLAGHYDTLVQLQTAHPTGVRGDAYDVGISPDNTTYLWDVATSSWKDIGALKGAKGDKGDTATINIGSVTEGNTMAVENVGTVTDAVLNFTLKKGDKGDTGNAATISIGTVTKGEEAAVVNVGTSTNAVFNMTLPKGDPGEQGAPTVVNGKTGQSITIYPSDMGMTGYVKATENEDVATTDTLMEAVGKLEKKADDNTAEVSSLKDFHKNNYYTVPTTAWSASVAHADYPYEAVISAPDKYSDSADVEYDLLVVAVTPPFLTEEEKESKAMLNEEADFDSTGFTLYASEVPTTALKILVKGEN